MDKIVYLIKKEEKGMLSIFDVARFFAQKEEKVNNTKIQKLCYYAQGWYLGFNDEPLFHEDFEAWVHGPVCRELYNEIRHKNSLGEWDMSRITESDKNFLDAVYSEYGRYNSMELSEMTHNETPWKITRGEKLWHEKSDNVISKNIIRDYFKEIVQKS